MEMTSYEPGVPSWVDLGTPDIEKAAAFYAGLFGWNSPEGPEEAGGYRLCDIGGKLVAGLGPQQPRVPLRRPLEVTDRDAREKIHRVTLPGFWRGAGVAGGGVLSRN